MLTRLFSIAGLIVRIAEWKASLLAFAARRSAIAMMGYLVAAIVALGGLAVLLGAAYVALEAVVGASLAMAAVGVFLLLAASLIWIVSYQRGKSKGQVMTEHDAWKNVARDEEMLRSLLGLTNDEDKPNFKRPGPSTQPSPQSNAMEGFDNPKVAMAAGFALLGLLGPGRLFKTVRIATALASVAALAHRAINEHAEKQGTQRAP